MKHMSSFLMLTLLAIATTSFAADGNRAQKNLYELEPVYTRNALNAQRITLNLTYENFRNVRIEEASDFDGYTTSAELMVPFGTDNSWELRLELPFYTDGDAWSLKNNEKIDIDGNGGVFDFASAVIQKEIMTADNCPVNASVYFGYGHRTQALETSIKDKYNHSGQMVRYGLNIDNAKADRDLRLQASLDGRHYFDTDDLNPSDNGDYFNLINLSSAVVYNAEGMFKPAFEILYSTDFDKRQIIQAVPELIVPLGDKLEVKGAFAIGDSKGEGTTKTGTIRTTFKF